MNYADLLKLASGEDRTTVTLVPRRKLTAALTAVVEFHKPMSDFTCAVCWDGSNDWRLEYPCPTIEAITKELQ